LASIKKNRIKGSRDELAVSLKECQIDILAMESTDVYCKAIFTNLSQNGFNLLLANSPQITISGRNDEDDDMICMHYELIKKTLTYSRCIPRMQKSKELMKRAVNSCK
jgi:hypothetical protein